MKHILFNTDGNDGGTQTAPPLDTSADLMNYDNSQTVIDPGNYQLKCIETELKANAAETVMLTLTNVENIRDMKGNVVDAGDGRVFAVVNTKLTGKMKPKMLNDGVSYVIQAFARPGVTSIAGLQENHNLLKGETCLVQLSTEPAGVKKDGQFREARTIVAKWYKKGTLPGQ